MRKLIQHPLTLAVAMSIATTAQMPVAWSQDDEMDLEEVIVTARKREENLQEVPLSVTAFNATTLQDYRMFSPEDIAAFTPGFSFVNSFGRDSDRPVVRGMSNILGSPNASFFIDGVFVPGTIASTELQMLERVEVIKGPQAALYGRATFSGAINYVTRRPTNEMEGQVTITVAEHDTTNTNAYVSGPIVEDSLYFYVGAGFNEYGGEYNNTISGDEVGGEETTTFTGKLLWTPTDSFEASLKLTSQKDDDDHIALWLQGADYNNCFEANPSRPAARGYYCGTVKTNDEVTLRTDFLPNPGIERDVMRTSLNMDWELGNGWTISSITGYQETETDRQIDVSYGGYDAFSFFNAFYSPTGQFWRVQEEEEETFSQELRLSSSVDQRLRWSVGAYWYDSEFKQTVDDRINPLTSFESALDPSVSRQEPNSFPEKTTVENFAIFGSVEFDFTDALTGTVEVRQATDDIESVFYPYLPGQETETFSEEFDSFTPRFTLTYLASDSLTVYGNIAKGTKPGGFNDSGAPKIAYDEEEAWNYEVGVKTTILNGRGTWNSSVYMIDWTDQQLTFNAQRPDGSLTSFIDNVGETSVTGFETELSMMLTDNWDLTANYSYTNAEIDEYINTDQAILVGCNPRADDYYDCIQANGSVEGNQTPRSPKHQASLRTMFRIPMGAGEWYVGGDIRYEGSKFAQVHNLAQTGSRTVVGAQAGYRTDRWEVTVWGKNLTDDDTAMDILRYIDTQAFVSQPGPPCSVISPAFNPAANCGGFFAWSGTNIGGGSVIPRGFGITLPRGRQIGATIRFNF
ncbi:MAG: TonB-dependent receptor [Luminiphilus sp.]|jgi:iron complex outermembrane receptor protein